MLQLVWPDPLMLRLSEDNAFILRSKTQIVSVTPATATKSWLAELLKLIGDLSLALLQAQRLAYLLHSHSSNLSHIQAVLMNDCLGQWLLPCMLDCPIGEHSAASFTSRDTDYLFIYNYKETIGGQLPDSEAINFAYLSSLAGKPSTEHRFPQT
jgi:hypothetical protein